MSMSLRSPADFPSRIAFLVPAAQLGGAERSLLDLISSLRRAMPAGEFHLILPVEGPLAAEAVRLGATVHLVPMPARLLRVGDTRVAKVNRLTRVTDAALSLPPLLGYLHRLRKTLKQIRAQIVHSNGMKTHILSAVVRPKGALLGWHMRDFLSGRPLVVRLLRRLAWRVHVVVAISEAVASDVRACLPDARVITILNAIDVDHFCPGPADPPWLDAAAGLPPPGEGVVRVGLVATYARWKGQDTFLRAAAHVLRRAGAGACFYIVGGSIYDTAGSQFSEQELRDMSSSLGIDGKVRFVPFQRDPLPVYRALDVVVHASTKPEPFGRTIAEAMACGKAVIAARAGGAVELFEPGVDALDFPSGDAGALADQIERLVADGALRSEMGLAARRSAIRLFDRNRLGPQVLEAYGAGTAEGQC